MISVLPSLIGFTLGGYAILIAFGDERFRAIITGASNGEKSSMFVVISATFMHFIVAQIVSLLYAIMIKHVCSPVVQDAVQEANQLCSLQFAGSEYVWQVAGFVGVMTFFYSIALAISATLAVFQISVWYDASKGGESE